jgi:hypothetical protein
LLLRESCRAVAVIARLCKHRRERKGDALLSAAPWRDATATPQPVQAMLSLAFVRRWLRGLPAIWNERDAATNQTTGLLRRSEVINLRLLIHTSLIILFSALYFIKGSFSRLTLRLRR